MKRHEIITISRDPEKEIATILIDSSLYLDMSPAERQKLIHHLVSSYFNLLPDRNRRALPTAMQIGPSM